MYFILIWMALCVLSLWVMGYRTDAELCFNSLINYVGNDNIFRMFINFIIILIILPFTLPKTIIHLFKK